MEKLLTIDNGTAEEYAGAAQQEAQNAWENATRALELRRELEIAPRHGEAERVTHQITAEAAANCAKDARFAACKARDYADWARVAADRLGAPEEAEDDAELARRMGAQAAAYEASAAWRRANWEAWRANDWAEQCSKLACAW